MKFDLSRLNFSRKDLLRGLTLPSEMNEALAEDIGIMVGDGCLHQTIRKTSTSNEIQCYGNATSDRTYYEIYVKNLKKELYNLNFSFLIKKKNTCALIRDSKGLFEFYTTIIGLPRGRKDNIGLPIVIWSDTKFIRACLRGLIDSDGSFQIKMRNYPVVKLNFASKKLIQDCQKAFNLLGLKVSIKTDCAMIHSITKRPYITNYLYLSGHEKIEQYTQLIGFSNPKNILKLQEYKTGSLGFEPRTP